MKSHTTFKEQKRNPKHDYIGAQMAAYISFTGITNAVSLKMVKYQMILIFL